MSEKYVADDGTVCQTKEQMLRINRKIEILLLPEKIRQVFNFLQSIEITEWLRANITKRGLPAKTFERLLEEAKRGH